MYIYIYTYHLCTYWRLGRFYARLDRRTARCCIVPHEFNLHGAKVDGAGRKNEGGGKWIGFGGRRGKKMNK